MLLHEIALTLPLRQTIRSFNKREKISYDRSPRAFSRLDGLGLGVVTIGTAEGFELTVCSTTNGISASAWGG